MEGGSAEREEVQAGEQTRSARQIVFQAALLGVLADNALRSASGGLGWAIWILGLITATVLVVRYRGGRLTREQKAWMALATACAAAVAWRDAEQMQAANVLGTLVSVSLLAMSSVGLPARSILGARARDVLAAGAYAAKDVLTGAPRLLFGEAEFGTAIRASATARRPALRAVLLTVPLVIVFAALLARADPVFGAIFRLPKVNPEDVFEHLVVGGIFAWFSAGWMRGALLPTGRVSPPDGLPLRLGVVEITSSLGALVGMFGVFVAIQLRWLFGGADVVQATTGLSLAEYARRGFFELVIVAALVVPLVLVTRAAISDEAAMRRHRRLSLALLVLIGAIMASAVLRMRLYVGHFGLTTDRLYALVFMAWIALVLIALALTVLRDWPRPFAAAAVISGFAALAVLNALNPEAFVARNHLGRAAAPRGVDYAYLARLSGDAAPAVAVALAGAEPSTETCASAKRMRSRWLTVTDAGSNAGRGRGRDAVLTHLTSVRVMRLCGLAGGR